MMNQNPLAGELCKSNVRRVQVRSAFLEHRLATVTLLLGAVSLPLTASESLSADQMAQIVAECNQLLESGPLAPLNGESPSASDLQEREHYAACEEFLQQNNDTHPVAKKTKPAKSAATRTIAKKKTAKAKPELTTVKDSGTAVTATPGFAGAGEPTRFLLKPRSLEMGLGLSYNSSSQSSALRANTSRDYSVPLSLKAGLGKSLEVSASIPLKTKVSNIITTDGSYSQSATGEGDVTLGLTYQLKEGHAYLPDMSVSLSLGIPTDSDTSPLLANQMRLGSAYRSTSVGMAFVKSSDPAVMFGSLTYRYVQEEQFGEVAIHPGAAISLGFGVGFSINNAITLTGILSNEQVADTRYNGQLIKGTGSEAIAFSTGLDYRMSRKHRMEFSVDYGLNEAANGVGFSTQYVYSLVR